MIVNIFPTNPDRRWFFLEILKRTETASTLFNKWYKHATRDWEAWRDAARFGGVLTELELIRTPRGRLFCCLSYCKDMNDKQHESFEFWRQSLIAFSHASGHAWAEICDDSFFTSDAESIPLDDCAVFSALPNSRPSPKSHSQTVR